MSKFSGRGRRMPTLSASSAAFLFPAWADFDQIRGFLDREARSLLPLAEPPVI